jgi:integrase
VLNRRVRDLDEGGTVLLISHGKTANARRRPEVPDFLRPHLLRLTAGKPADAFLFGSRANGEPLLTGYLIRQVHQICEQAGVPKVCAHSLRGLHATLALRQGVSTQAVAAALGHGSFAVTARHYADPTQLLNARVRSVITALREPSSEVALPELAATLCTSLAPSQIDELIRLLSVGSLPKQQLAK